MNKVCSKCDKTKDITEYYKSKQYTCGRLPLCKECYKNNYVSKAYHSSYYKKHSKSIKAKSAIWRKNNRERYLEMLRCYREENKEQLHKKQLEYWKNNRERKHVISKRFSDESCRLLKDTYIISIIHQQTMLSYATIRMYPELIDSFRQQVKIKRLLRTTKNKQHGNTKEISETV